MQREQASKECDEIIASIGEIMKQLAPVMKACFIAEGIVLVILLIL